MKVGLQATVQLRGINPYVLIAAEHAARLAPDWRKPMPVRAWLNGRPAEGWVVNLMPVGDGGFYLYLNGGARSAAAVTLGNRVEVTLMFATDYRPGPAMMPAAFQTAFEADQRAKRGWEALPPNRQKEIVRYLIGLKSDEALNRNIGSALHVLAGGAARFMARDWNAGGDGIEANTGSTR